jgi:hypothetical protein
MDFGMLFGLIQSTCYILVTVYVVKYVNWKRRKK